LTLEEPKRGPTYTTEGNNSSGTRMSMICGRMQLVGGNQLAYGRMLSVGEKQKIGDSTEEWSSILGIHETEPVARCAGQEWGRNNG